MVHSSVQRLRLWLIGSDPRERLRASQSLLALTVYAVFAVVQQVEASLGLIDQKASWVLTAFYLGGGLCFYLAIRCSRTLRRWSDAALTVPQMLWAMSSIAWSYAISGPLRGAVLLVMMLVILFGMFGLPRALSRALTTAGFVMLALAATWKCLSDPAHHDPRVEALNLVFVGVVMAACATLAMQHRSLRIRLEDKSARLAEALARIQELATRDELTGLLNRRALTDRLQLELQRRHSARPLVALALLDLDHFKRINDRHGHAAGDAVLRRFAQAAERELRVGDSLARWGGEEFLLMLPATDADSALAVLDRIRTRFRAMPMDDVAPGLVPAFSAGVALCESVFDMEPAIERADAAMYRAKAAGRDRALGP